MFTKFFKLILSAFFLLAAIGTSHFRSITPAQAAGSETSETLPVNDLTPEKLEDFVDSFVAEHMETYHAPGMVITVVSNGETIFSKGYGVANLDEGDPFTPQTPLRAGSVSKVITAAAVMHFVDQGLIELNAPISSYITDLPLEDSFGSASTVSQLLTLQGGYPEVLLQTHSPTQAKWLPLGDYLAHYLPERTIRPGTVYSYTSWEHALLGYALERIQAAPFDQVMENTLFGPLQMENSTFAQPPSADLLNSLAHGYFYQNGQYEQVPYDYVNLTPGIGMVTTSDDIGRFLEMLLNGDGKDGVRFLQPGSLDGMLVRQNEVHPYSRARSFGFSEINLGGRAALYQDGNGIGFANRMVVLPEHGFGMFISTNHRALGTDLSRTPANTFIQELSVGIVETFFPESSPVYPPGTVLPDASERAGRYSGHYSLAGTSQSDFFKVGALLDYVDVRDNHDGSIQIGSRRYVEVDPMVFRSVEEPTFYVIFTADPEGQVEYLAFGGTGTYAKVGWGETFNFHVGLVAGIMLISLVTAVVWPFTRRSTWLLWLINLLQIVFLTGLGWTLTKGDLLVFYKEISLQMYVLLALPWAHLALTIAALFTLVRRPMKLKSAVLPAVAALGFIGFAWYWQLFL